MKLSKHRQAIPQVDCSNQFNFCKTLATFILITLAFGQSHSPCFSDSLWCSQHVQLKFWVPPFFPSVQRKKVWCASNHKKVLIFCARFSSKFALRKHKKPKLTIYKGKQENKHPDILRFKLHIKFISFTTRVWVCTPRTINLFQWNTFQYYQ